jgi:hypothetical protein
MSMQFRLMSTMTAAALALMVGSSAFGQVQGKGQAKCINTLNKDIGKTAATAGKNNSSCVKGATKGTPSATCVTQDGSGKVGATINKASGDETKNLCLTTNAPNFGYSAAGSGSNSTNATGAAGAALTAEVNLFSDTYGTTDTTGVISTTKADAKCQSAVTKDLEKSMATRWKSLEKCKKTDLATDANGAGIVACVQATSSDAKVVATVGKLGSDIGKDCTAAAGVVIATDFPGGCSGSTVANLNTCLDGKAACRFCQAMNSIDNLGMDCTTMGCAPTCGISAAGRYTETSGPGELKVSTFAAFPFPAGSVTVQDVSAPDANCVSNTVIPYPGGLSTPVFCVPALGYTVRVAQTGCGVGIIDSDGGSDLTVDEKGDTSFNGGTCNTTQSCAAFADSSGLVRIKVGDGTVDTCASGGTGNAMVSIPVFTTTWLSTNGCPDTDGDPSGGDDTIITQFPQTLDQTTDRATAEFADLDADGCSIKGVGPAGPYTTNQLCTAAGAPYACCTGSGTGTCVGNGGLGVCIDFVGATVSVAGGGTVFSSAAPLHDLLFTNILPNTIAHTGPNLGATCGSPPPVNFAGTADRCIVAP